MKIKSNFILHESDGQAVLVSTGGSSFSGFVRGNDTLGEILALLRYDTTEEQVVSEMKKRYSAPRGLIEQDVRKVISKLREAGALEE